MDEATAEKPFDPVFKLDNPIPGEVELTQLKFPPKVRAKGLMAYEESLGGAIRGGLALVSAETGVGMDYLEQLDSDDLDRLMDYVDVFLGEQKSSQGKSGT